MAQLVARLVRNEKVGGSNPPSSTTSKVCPARKLAGQTCFRGDFGQGIDAGVGKDADGGLVGCVGGVLFAIDGDAGEQGRVEDASLCWFALVVEVVEVDQEFGELVESGSGASVVSKTIAERTQRVVVRRCRNIQWSREHPARGQRASIQTRAMIWIRRSMSTVSILVSGNKKNNSSRNH